MVPYSKAQISKNYACVWGETDSASMKVSCARSVVVTSYKRLIYSGLLTICNVRVRRILKFRTEQANEVGQVVTHLYINLSL